MSFSSVKVDVTWEIFFRLEEKFRNWNLQKHSVFLLFEMRSNKGEYLLQLFIKDIFIEMKNLP